MRRWCSWTLVFLVIVMCGGNAKAEELNSNLHIALYSYQIDYPGSSLKDNGSVTTGYLRSGDDKTYNMEFALSRTHIDYKNTSDLDQTDVVFAYTNTGDILPNHNIRGGIHYIDSDDDLTDDGFVLFGKMIYSRETTWDAGLELDYSIYEDSSTDLRVFQVAPSMGFYLTQDPSQGVLYTESKLYYIHKNKDLAISRHNFFSFEQTLSYYQSPFDAKVSAWVGEQMFAVKNDGFVVYNLQDRYNGGIKFDAGYTIENRLRIGLVVGYDWLKHTETNDRAAQKVVSISIGAIF